MESPVPAGRLRPEAQLILACCAPGAPDALAGRAAGLLEANFDWDWLERCANLNGVTPMVARRLTACELPDSVAPHIRRFKIVLQANALRNEHMAAELARILERFSTVNINALAFKGPVLAATAYGDLAIRSFGDLDLLVRRDDIARAVRILVEDGYGLATARRFDPEIFSVFEGGFEAARGDDHVDLHCRIRRRRFHFFPDDDGIWQRSISIDLNGHRVATFAPSDLALYLAAHASKHGWSSLQMVCDFSAVMRSRELDADAVLEQAAQLGCRRMVLMGLCLDSLLLGTTLSGGAARLLRDEPTVKAMAATIADRMFSGIVPDYQPENPSGIAVRLMDRPSDRVRYWFFRAVTPTVGDWEFMPMPRAFYPAYFFIRLVRLSLKWIEKSLGGD